MDDKNNKNKKDFGLDETHIMKTENDDSNYEDLDETKIMKIDEDEKNEDIDETKLVDNIELKNEDASDNDETRILNPIDKDDLGEDVIMSKTKKETNKENKKDDKKKYKKTKTKKNHKKLKIFFKTLLIILLILIVAAIAGFFAILKTNKWTISKDEFLSDGGAKIYNKDGEIITTLTGDEINKKVELSEMGRIPEAFVSIEDERFYEHKGVDVKRTTHAILSYIFTGGKSNFGGSTITQQLVKITMKDDQRSGAAGVQRKIREWSRANQVEEMLTKDQILQRYLNRIYLGSSNGLEIRGVESASLYYFSKSAKDLSIAQSCFIAGINHSPAYYDPFTSTDDETMERIKSRTKTVINKMAELGKISDEEKQQALDEVNNGLEFKQGSLSNGKSDVSYLAAAAINQIAQELSDKNDIEYSEARDVLISSGYSIYTTEDTDIQNKMKTIFEDPKYQVKGTNPKDRNADRTGQSAMVIIEPSTGYVVGEMGGLGADADTLGLNRGTSKRQGGSSFKPLVTIAPGLENNVITAATLFYDAKTTFAGNYTVRNDSDRYYGVTDMRTILTHSLNVPEIKLLSIMGVQKSIDFLSQLNIQADASAGLSMALGTIDVSPLQMAAGYAMIANGGKYITPTFYTKVLDRSGNTVIEAKQETKQVMSAENAYIEESLLTGPVKSGTASRFASYLGKMDVGAKTGTTQTAGDRWLCGFTPYYAAACWYGNDNNNGEFRGTNPAATVWFNVMKLVHQDLATKSFEKPDGIVTVKVCKDTGRKAGDKCTNTYSEIFAKSNVPDVCTGHTTIKVCKQTGKLATEFCPDVEERTNPGVIDTEKNATWSPKISESKDFPTETCDVHTKAPDVEVPDVVGKTQTEAKKILEAAGFVADPKLDNINGYNKDQVSSQIPKAKEKAAKGSKVTITVNQSDNRKTVPNVEKKTLSEAKTAIESAGFAVDIQYKEDVAGYANAQVVSQSPKANEKAAKGTKVTIIVNKTDKTTNNTKKTNTETKIDTTKK